LLYNIQTMAVLGLSQSVRLQRLMEMMQQQPMVMTSFFTLPSSTGSRF